MATLTSLQAAAQRGIDVSEMAVEAHAQAQEEVSRLTKIIREALQHLEHERPFHALRALEKIDVD